MTDREVADRLAGYIFQLMDGDDYMIEDMYKFLHNEGYCDEEGFQIYNEDEE